MEIGVSQRKQYCVWEMHAGHPGSFLSNLSFFPPSFLPFFSSSFCLPFSFFSFYFLYYDLQSIIVIILVSSTKYLFCLTT